MTTKPKLSDKQRILALERLVKKLSDKLELRHLDINALQRDVSHLNDTTRLDSWL